MTGDIIVNIEKLILNLKEMQQIKNSQDNLEKKNKRSYIGVIYIYGGVILHDIKRKKIKMEESCHMISRWILR